MTTSTIFNEKHIYLDKSFENKNELFHFIAIKLISEGYVEKDYETALKEREENFPTGLATEKFGIAIPHCDAIHVKKQCISFIRMKSPVTFNQMGSISNETVDCKFAFVLSVKEPSKQVNVLVTLVGLIQDSDFMSELLQSNSETEICNKLNQRFTGVI